MQNLKNSKKKRVSLKEFTKSDQIIESQGSHREVNSKKDQESQARSQLNFQREEMRNIRQKMFIKKAIKRLQALVSLQKTPQNIRQQWQIDKQPIGNQKTDDNQNFTENIAFRYAWMKVISIIQGASLIFLVWMISISIVFQQKVFDTQYVILFSLEAIFIFIKILVMKCNEYWAQTSCDLKIKKLFASSMAIIACSLMLIKNSIQHSILIILIDILASVVLLFIAKRVSGYFQIFRVYAQNKKIIKQLRIVQMFCILFVIAHIFGLIIYSSTYLTPVGGQNWLSLISVQQKYWHTKYIYSVYWAITTIATVGYGDLTPQNQIQVIVIVILQICGTSFFGYMINVIGITVDTINKKNVEYDNYQQTISKLKDHYQLSEDLCVSMKNDIKKKYEESDKTVPLKKNQETQLLQFVDSTVKKNFILQTNIKIIKKSIFFLTYFTVNFQNEIALKLIRSIYKKDENIQIFDAAKKQRNIVIINHGKVNLYLKKRQNNSVISKLVRTIQPIEGKPTLNVVGFSNLILNQNIDINAVASEMTSGYVLKRSDVLDCIDRSLIDYQSLHQMRQKMLLISLKESIEAPSLKDSDFHFTPNTFILTCRYSKMSKQQRKKKKRRDSRIQMSIDQVKVQFNNDWYNVKKEDSESYFDQQQYALTKNFKKLNQFESLLEIEESPIPIEDSSKEIQEKQYLRLDQVKIFQHFLNHHNINQLATQYQKSCKTKSYNQRIMTTLLKKQNPSYTEKLSSKLKTIKSMKMKNSSTQKKQ